MPLPVFDKSKPIQVRFLTDYARAMQANSISGTLKEASPNLVKSVMIRTTIDDTVTESINSANEREYGAQHEDLSDPLSDTLENVINGIMTGKSLDEYRDDIKRYIHNQQDRSDLIINLLLTKDYQRLLKFVKVRDDLEAKLLAAAGRTDLNASEMMAFSQLITEMTAKLEGRVQAGSTNVSDVMALLSKADYALQLQEETTKKKFKQTTPTGREIVRRLVHKLSKISKDDKTPGKEGK
jgi:hypothetical protein